MSEEPEDLPVTPTDDTGAPDRTVGETVARLYADARAYADAELGRQRLRAGIVAGGVRDAAIFVLVALMLLFGTIVALLIGLIIALSPALTPLGATGAVVGGAILVALLLLLLAKGRITRMKKAMRP